MPRSRSYHDELLQDLQDPVEAQGYLNAVLEENDPELLQLALRHVVEARLRMTDPVDPQTNVLYQQLSESTQPDLICLNRVLSLLGCRLAIQTQEQADEMQLAS